MSLLLSAVLCVLGWILLANSQHSQRRRLRVAPLNAAQTASRRVAGAIILAAALGAAVAGLGPSLGLVFWLAVLGSSGFALSVALGFAVPRRRLC